MTHRLAHITTVLLDVGNTLHHLDHSYIAECVAVHGFPVSATEVAQAESAAKRLVDAAFRSRRAGTDTTRQIKYFDAILANLGVAAQTVAEIAGELHAENARACLWRVMHGDTPRVLAELRERGLRLGVVSNADGRVQTALRESGIADYFDTIIDSHVVGVEKPQRAIFEMAVAACNSSAAASLFVGDIYEIDVRGARDAGLTPVLLDPLRYYVEPDCLRIDALAELPKLLER